jgi:peroxiredoxin
VAKRTAEGAVRRRLRRATVAATLLLGVFGAGLPAAASGADEPVAAPDFALKALDGRNHRLSEHRGEVVALLFWGSWCGGCRRELERLERLKATYAQAGLTAYGIVLDEEPAEARAIAAALGTSYAQLHDATRTVAKAYRPRALPTLLLVDRGGAVRHAYGELDARAERAMLADLRGLLDE